MGIQVKAPAEAVGLKECVTESQEVIRPLTRNQQLVYDTLCQSETALKAYGLLEKLRDQGLCSPMTIYRALEALIDKRYVRKIASLNAFIAIRSDDVEQMKAFLICRECMKVKEITIDEARVAELLSPAMVSLKDVSIEAFSDCQQVCDQV